MRYTIGRDGEILQQRDNCPSTCNSVTGTSSGSCCRCCPLPDNCSFFTSSVQCPTPPPPEPTPPPPQCCVTKIIVRNSGRYLVNSNGSIQRGCC